MLSNMYDDQNDYMESVTNNKSRKVVRVEVFPPSDFAKRKRCISPCRHSARVLCHTARCVSSLF